MNNINSNATIIDVLVVCWDEDFLQTKLAILEVRVLYRSWCAYGFFDLGTGYEKQTTHKQLLLTLLFS